MFPNSSQNKSRPHSRATGGGSPNSAQGFSGSAPEALGSKHKARPDAPSPPPRFQARRDAETPSLDPLLRVIRIYGGPKNRCGGMFVRILLQDPKGRCRIHGRGFTPPRQPGWTTTRLLETNRC